MANGELKTHCLCGVHVHTGTKIILWLNIVLNSLYLVVLFVTLGILLTSPNDFHSMQDRSSTQPTRETLMAQIIAKVVSTSIGLALNGMVLYGLKNGRPGFYWPYLVVVAIAIVIMLFYAGISVILSVAVSIGMAGGQGQIGAAGGLLFLNVLLIFLVIAAIYFSFIVVNRSRKVLESEIYNPVPPAYDPKV